MSGQTPQFGDLSIGKAAADEFVRLPRPDLFTKRARLIAAVAEGHPMAGFLRLMEQFFTAQAGAVTIAGMVEPPSDAALALAAEHGMPLLSPDMWTPTATYRDALRII